MLLIFLWVLRFSLMLVSLSLRAGVALAERASRREVGLALSSAVGSVEVVRVSLMVVSWVVGVMYFVLVFIAFVLVVVAAIVAIGLLTPEEAVKEVSMIQMLRGTFI